MLGGTILNLTLFTLFLFNDDTLSQSTKSLIIVSLTIFLYCAYAVFVFVNSRALNFKLYLYALLHGYRMQDYFNFASVYIVKNPWKKVNIDEDKTKTVSTLREDSSNISELLHEHDTDNNSDDFHRNDYKNAFL